MRSHLGEDRVADIQIFHRHLTRGGQNAALGHGACSIRCYDHRCVVGAGQLQQKRLVVGHAIRGAAAVAQNDLRTQVERLPLGQAIGHDTRRQVERPKPVGIYAQRSLNCGNLIGGQACLAAIRDNNTLCIAQRYGRVGKCKTQRIALIDIGCSKLARSGIATRSVRRFNKPFVHRWRGQDRAVIGAGHGDGDHFGRGRPCAVGHGDREFFQLRRALTQRARQFGIQIILPGTVCINGQTAEITRLRSAPCQAVADIGICGAQRAAGLRCGIIRRDGAAEFIGWAVGDRRIVDGGYTDHHRGGIRGTARVGDQHLKAVLPGEIRAGHIAKCAGCQQGQ